MNLVGGIAVYFVIWWTVLFLALPFGIRSQAEAGDIVKGSEHGAPDVPHLGRKALVTTIIAAIVFVPVWYVWSIIGI